MTEYPSCVPKRTEFKSFTLREDFFAIVNNDIINAAVLSVAEMKTNEIIEKFRTTGNTPGDGLPSEEQLWFDLSLRDAENITLGIRSKSAYARALSLKNEDDIPSLIQLGFLRHRIVAYAYESQRLPPGAATKFRRDIWNRRYIIVEDTKGHFTDDNSTVHNAIEEGFRQISHQYLLLIDCVNAAIATLC